MEAGVVLVAESDAPLRRWMAERVALAGHRPVEAGDVPAALSALEREHPGVALLGALHPPAQGQSLLEVVLSRTPGLAAVVASTDCSVAAGVAAMKQGAADYLVVPCAPEKLDAAVDGALRLARGRRLIAETGARPERCALVGQSAAMRRVKDVIDQLAAGDGTTVLLEGETGTGKEAVAQAIHSRSARSGQPFLKVNCAAFPEALIDSELFGHERGAFTTAHGRRTGLIEAARGGTLLLDEMGDLAPSGQAKLLRLLENRTFRRVGGVEELSADVRIIAATHADLERRVDEGRFRSDLFFRLNVVRVRLPPLRERREDIAPLAAFFLAQHNARRRRSVRGISGRALEILERHCWPGNVRELRNVIERALILYPWMDEFRPQHLTEALHGSVPETPRPLLTASLSLRSAERELLADAMRRAHGNQVHAARMLGITRFTLRYRLRKYGLGMRETATNDPLAAAV